MPLLNVNLAKAFHLHERFKLEPHVEVFNILNNAGVVAQSWATGASTFGKITSLEAPRVARLGAEFSFLKTGFVAANYATMAGGFSG